MPITKQNKAGTALGSGLAGAGTGAAIGSVIPGLGTALGAGLGGLLGLAGGYLSSAPTYESVAKQQAKMGMGGNGSYGTTPQGLPEGVGTYSVYSPQQQAALNSILQSGLQGIGTNKFDFSPIEQQARQGFAQQTIPSIAERFTAMGSGPGSSGFNRAVAQAGKGLETDLASMKQGYNLQQQALMQNLLNLGLTPQYEAYYRPGDQGFAQSLLGQQNIGDILKLAGHGMEYFKNRKGNIPGDDGMGGAGFQAPGMNPLSYLGSTQGIYNPGNIVSGMQTPGNIVSGVGLPQGIQEMPTSNLGALKALYGIQ